MGARTLLALHFADLGDIATATLLLADLVAPANAAALARNIADMRAVCALWVEREIIPAAPRGSD